MTVGIIEIVGVGLSVWVIAGVLVGPRIGGVVGAGVGVSVGLGDGVGVGLGQASGSVPLIKYSVPDADAIATPGVGIRQNGALTMDGGCRKDSSGLFLKKFSIRSLQIGAAPTDPAILSIAVLSLFPTHTPTTTLGV